MDRAGTAPCRCAGSRRGAVLTLRKKKPSPAANRAGQLALLGEVFREHGYEGASLTLITKATGLGKGSLYHLFPGGKQQMAAEVLAEIDSWFERNVFVPLRETKNAREGIARMFDAVDDYFRSGRRVCLVGVFALGAARDEFAMAVQGYFKAWHDALTAALCRAGHARAEATALSEDVLAGIQGALVLARAANDPKVFARALARLEKRTDISRLSQKAGGGIGSSP